MSRAATPEQATALLKRGDSARVDVEVPARFKPGDEIRTLNLNPAGHIRLPRYARTRRGVIDRDHGVFIFPDTHAAGQGQKPQHCYSVKFSARELFGGDANDTDSVYIDLFDDYLELVQE
ncbi:MAG: SH3-like domain-containing protein [Gammaproteobacteria bacterium]